jgi:hypothetical protein
MADLFHLFRYNMVAGDVGDIPDVPDEAANGEHRNIVTQCVTKSRRGEVYGKRKNQDITRIGATAGREYGSTERCIACRTM